MNRFGVRVDARRLALCAVLLLFSLQLLSSSSAAAVSDEAARELFQQGRYDEAADAYWQLFLESPDDPQLNFWLGRACFEKGDYEAAVMAFERVLIARPDADRVKLELARCFLALGSRGVAARYFEEVLAGNPPQSVRDNIEGFLAAIKGSEQKHLLSGFVSAGLARDDNVRAAPGEDLVATVLGDVLLDDAASDAESDWLTQATINLNHAYRLRDDRLFWQSSAVTYHAFHADAHDLDLNFIALATGPLVQNGRWQLAAHGLFNYLDLDDRAFLRGYGGDGVLNWLAQPRLMVSARGKYEKKNYARDEGRDADNYSLRLGPIWSGAGWQLRLSVLGELENARDDRYSYRRGEGALSGEKSLGRWLVSAGYRYQYSRYDEVEPLFAERRRDDLHELSAGLSRELWRGDGTRQLRARISHIYSRNDSNLGLYDYDRNLTQASLIFSF